MGEAWLRLLKAEARLPHSKKERAQILDMSRGSLSEASYLTWRNAVLATREQMSQDLLL
jgi:hypothetical protein